MRVSGRAPGCTNKIVCDISIRFEIYYDGKPENFLRKKSNRISVDNDGFVWWEKFLMEFTLRIEIKNVNIANESTFVVWKSLCVLAMCLTFTNCFIICLQMQDVATGSHSAHFYRWFILDGRAPPNHSASECSIFLYFFLLNFWPLQFLMTIDWFKNSD